jgi:hypothetical protein
LLFLVCKVSELSNTNKEKRELFYFSAKIKNTRHSSGIGVNAKNINSIEPDECPDDSSGTHQVGISCISEDYRQT